MKINIVVNFSFEAIHCWPECDIQDVLFLRNPHRHKFYVTAKKETSHSDRAIEIIKFKREMEKFVSIKWQGDLGRMSCEDVCECLMRQFNLSSVMVLEDNENGAEVIA